jgi:hypothetical protein
MLGLSMWWGVSNVEAAFDLFDLCALCMFISEMHVSSL